MPPLSYRRVASRLTCSVIMALFLLSSNASEVGAQAATDLTLLLAWEDSIVLQENADVINVLYNVDIDPLGGFLVSDTREGQFRRYDDHGDLLWSFGRPGRGPSEFRSPVSAVRLGVSTNIALLDRQGKVAVYDEAGDSLVSTGRSGLIRVQDAAVLPSGDLWVATGINDNTLDAPDLFHLVNPVSGTVETGIAGPSIPEDRRKEMAYMNWSGISADPTGDTLWAVVATRDTIYALDPHLRTIVRRLPIESPLVRPLTRATEAEFGDPLGRRRWAEKQSYLTDVFPLTDGRLLVLFQDFRNSRPAWGVLLLDRNGVVQFGKADTHRLLAVDPMKNLLYFQDREELEGNRWLVGRLR